MSMMYCKEETALVLLGDFIPTEHLEWVAQQLGCNLEELVVLDIQPDTEDFDEEGWNLTSFFPEGVEVKSEMLESNRLYDDFQISNIQKITAEGVTYIGDQDACPWTIYAKYNEQMIKTL